MHSPWFRFYVVFISFAFTHKPDTVHKYGHGTSTLLKNCTVFDIHIQDVTKKTANISVSQN